MAMKPRAAVAVVAPSAAEDLQKLRQFYQSKLNAQALPASQTYWPSWAVEAQRWVRALDAGIAALRAQKPR